jgi:hypothetical protein
VRPPGGPLGSGYRHPGAGRHTKGLFLLEGVDERRNRQAEGPLLDGWGCTTREQGSTAEEAKNVAGLYMEGVR